MSSKTNAPKRSMRPDPVLDEADDRRQDAANADAITGAPGSHPVGTGIGAAAAGAAGAVLGSAIPGVGTAIGGAVGAVIGAVAGGYAGKAVAEAIDPTDEDAYWRHEYRNRPYYDADLDYERDYAPAYRIATDTYNSKPGRRYEESLQDLQTSWNAQRQSQLDWDRAQHVMRDVYERDRTTGEGTRKTGTSDSSVSNT